MNRDQQLSDLQLAIMKVLWDHGEASAAEVHEALAERRKLALTTVSTMLQRLEKREFVGHRTEGRQFVYTARVNEDDIRHSDVADLTRRWFQGDATALVSHLLGDADISSADLERVRSMLASRTKGGGKRRNSR